MKDAACPISTRVAGWGGGELWPAQREMRDQCCAARLFRAQRLCSGRQVRGLPARAAAGSAARRTLRRPSPSDGAGTCGRRGTLRRTPAGEHGTQEVNAARPEATCAQRELCKKIPHRAPPRAAVDVLLQRAGRTQPGPARGTRRVHLVRKGGGTRGKRARASQTRARSRSVSTIRTTLESAIGAIGPPQGKGTDTCQRSPSSLHRPAEHTPSRRVFTQGRAG